MTDLGGFQKIRLAHDEGATGEKLPATRGHFSEKFYRRMIAAMRLAPELVQHIVAMVDANGGLAEKVHGSREAPLPMNEGAFNDANEVYSRLVYFAILFSAKLNRQAPGPAKRAWSNESGKIVGLPVDITANDARYLIGIMAKWLEVNMEDLLGTNDLDAIQYFHDELARDLFRLNAKWPRDPKPRWSEMPCPNCGGRIGIFPPAAFEADELIKCDACGFVILPTRYDTYVKHYNMIQTEADPVKKHLMKLYLKIA